MVPLSWMKRNFARCAESWPHIRGSLVFHPCWFFNQSEVDERAHLWVNRYRFPCIEVPALRHADVVSSGDEQTPEVAILLSPNLLGAVAHDDPCPRQWAPILIHNKAPHAQCVDQIDVLQ